MAEGRVAHRLQLRTAKLLREVVEALLCEALAQPNLLKLEPAEDILELDGAVLLQPRRYLCISSVVGLSIPWAYNPSNTAICSLVGTQRALGIFAAAADLEHSGRDSVAGE